MSSRDHKIVKIMPEASWKVPGPAQYSLDNGFTLTNFRPGGVHSVPDYVAWGMERRGWAKVLTDDEIDKQDTVDTEISTTERKSDKRRKE